MSDTDSERWRLLKAKLTLVETEFQDVPLGVRGAIYIELMLDTMLASVKRWPDCWEFGQAVHEIYHGYTRQREERAAAN